MALQSFNANFNTNTIELIFDQATELTDADLAQFVLLAMGTSAARLRIIIAGSTIISGTSPTTDYTVRLSSAVVNFIKTQSIGWINSGSTFITQALFPPYAIEPVTTYTPDTTPVSVVTAEYNRTTGVLALDLSKPTISCNPDQLVLTGAGGVNTVTLTGATVAINPARAYVQLTPSQIQATRALIDETTSGPIQLSVTANAGAFVDWVTNSSLAQTVVIDVVSPAYQLAQTLELTETGIVVENQTGIGTENSPNILAVRDDQFQLSVGSVTTPTYFNSIASDGTRFVAMDGYTNQAYTYTSPDGATWTEQTLPQSALWRSVAYGAGTFVAVALGTDIAATSPDGITWTQQTLPASVQWQSLAYGAGTFVAVASGTDIAATSPDGMTWTQQTLPASVQWQSLAYGNGVWVAVSRNNNIAATSTDDGVTWIQQLLPTSIGDTNIVYGAGVFVVAVPDQPNNRFQVYKSSDGATWETQSLPTETFFFWRAVVAFASDMFLIAAPATAFYSIDGAATWTETASSPISQIWNPWAIAANSNSILVARNPGRPVSYIATPNFNDQVKINGLIDLGDVGNITITNAGQGRYLQTSSAGGLSASLITSLSNTSSTVLQVSDPYYVNYNNFQTLSFSNPSTLEVLLITDVKGISNQAEFLLMDSNYNLWTTSTPSGSTYYNNINSTLSSADWSAVISKQGSPSWYRAFIAVARGTDQAAYGQSYNPANYTTMPSVADWSALAFNDDLSVAVAVSSGSSTAAARTTDDGATWTASTLPQAADWVSIAYGAGVFVAVSNTNTVAVSSDDGVTWTAHTIPGSTYTYNQVVFGNGYFLAAVSTDVASFNFNWASSTDGMSWSNVSSPPSNLSRVSVTYSSTTLYFLMLDLVNNRLFYWDSTYSPTQWSWQSYFYPSPIPSAVSFKQIISNQNSPEYGSTDFIVDGPTQVRYNLLSNKLNNIQSYYNAVVDMSSSPVRMNIDRGIFISGAGLSEGDVLTIDNQYKIAPGRVSSIGTSSSPNIVVATSGILTAEVNYHQLPNWNYWRCCAYGARVLVAGGRGLAISFDQGVSWSGLPLPAGVTNLNASAMLYANNIFVMLQDAGSTNAFTSPDGITWTPRTLPVGGSWRSIAYGNNLFVAASYSFGSTVITSPDGITWTQRSLPISANWSQIVFGAGIFLAMPNYNTQSVYTSSDGVTWTEIMIPGSSILLTNWYSAAYGNGIFVIKNRLYFAVSEDGTSWTVSKEQFESNYFYLAYGDGYFVLGNGYFDYAKQEGSAIGISTDGLTWQFQETPKLLNNGTFNQYFGTCFIFAKDRFVGVGQSDVSIEIISTASANRANVTQGFSAYTSQDFQLANTISDVISQEIYGIAYGANTFVALGQYSGNTNTSVSSSDGVTWTTRTLPLTSDWRHVAYGSNVFVAAPYTANSYVATSSDGAIWTQRNLPLRSAPFTGNASWVNLVYGNGIFLLYDSYTIARSEDGITWDYINLPGINNAFNIVYGDGVFVLASGNSISISNPDATGWVSTIELFSTNVITLSKIFYLNNRYFISLNITSDYMLSSEDAINWFKITIPLLNVEDMNYLDGLYMLDTASIQHWVSTDLVNWYPYNLALPSFSGYSGSYGRSIAARGNIYTTYSSSIQTRSQVQILTSATYRPNNVISTGYLTVTNGIDLGPVQGIQISGGSANQALFTDSSGVMRFETISALSTVSDTNIVTVSDGSVGVYDFNFTSVAARPSGSQWQSGASGNGIIVMISGWSQLSNRFVVSTDGAQTWNLVTVSSSLYWSDITYSPDLGIFVAIAYNSRQVSTSTNGTTWTNYTTALPSATSWSSVAYGKGIFVAVALGTNQSATSTNGTTWTSRTLPVSAAWFSIAYGDGLFMVVAQGSTTALISSDGINWTQRTLPSNSPNHYTIAAIADGVMLASVGYTQFATKLARSVDGGVTWTEVAVPYSFAGGYANGGTILYRNGVFFFIGNHNNIQVIVASTDRGLTWELAAWLPWYGSGSGYGSLTYDQINDVCAAIPYSTDSVLSFRIDPARAGADVMGDLRVTGNISLTNSSQGQQLIVNDQENFQLSNVTSWTSRANIEIGSIFVGSSVGTTAAGAITTTPPNVTNSGGGGSAAAPTGSYRCLGGISTTQCLWVRVS